MAASVVSPALTVSWSIPSASPYIDVDGSSNIGSSSGNAAFTNSRRFRPSLNTSPSFDAAEPVPYSAVDGWWYAEMMKIVQCRCHIYCDVESLEEAEMVGLLFAIINTAVKRHLSRLLLSTNS